MREIVLRVSGTEYMDAVTLCKKEQWSVHDAQWLAQRVQASFLANGIIELKDSLLSKVNTPRPTDVAIVKDFIQGGSSEDKLELDWTDTIALGDVRALAESTDRDASPEVQEALERIAKEKRIVYIAEDSSNNVPQGYPYFIVHTDSEDDTICVFFKDKEIAEVFITIEDSGHFLKR